MKPNNPTKPSDHDSGQHGCRAQRVGSEARGVNKASNLSIRFLCLVTTLTLLCGCITERETKEFETQFREALAPFADLARNTTGARDLAYATAAFQRKNGRWPNDHAELSTFVQASDGLLVLGTYDRVDYLESDDGGLSVSFLLAGQTNSGSFTFRAKDAETSTKLE